ncbi:MAG: ABC transporter permease [Thermoleophilaceae bacterium]
MAATTPVGTRIAIETGAAAPASQGRRLLGGIWAQPVVRAVVRGVLTVFVVITMTFFIIRLMPGNPVDLYINQIIAETGISYAEAADQASGLFNLDLNAPIHEQYVGYLGKLVRADLGTSLLSRGTPVTALILAFLPWTLFSVGTGLLLSFVVGVFLGLLAAYRRNSAFDSAVSSIGSVVSSVPNYLMALIIVVFAGTQFRLLPIAQMRGSSSPGIEPGLTLAYIGDILFHGALPITVFFLTTIGYWILSMKSATLATLEEDYVTVARARGLPDGRITTAYVGRNAILPLVTQFAIAAGHVVGGAIFVEFILVYPGVGLRLYQAIQQRDYPVMEGIVLVITVSVVAANIIADLFYSKLDPRIGRAGGAGG